MIHNTVMVAQDKDWMAAR